MFGIGGGFFEAKKLAELELRGTLARVNFGRFVLLKEELCESFLPNKLVSSGLFSVCDNFLSRTAVTMGLEEVMVPL